MHKKNNEILLETTFCPKIQQQPIYEKTTILFIEDL